MLQEAFEVLPGNSSKYFWRFWKKNVFQNLISSFKFKMFLSSKALAFREKKSNEVSFSSPKFLNSTSSCVSSLKNFMASFSNFRYYDRHCNTLNCMSKDEYISEIKSLKSQLASHDPYQNPEFWKQFRKPSTVKVPQLAGRNALLSQLGRTRFWADRSAILFMALVYFQ